jgi:2-keto-4-pentenoate hydratase/2-oxohepta-3-ene-1,7-dioic acid hydratase in catechol pathway
MKRLIVPVAAAGLLAASAVLTAQTPAPFKLGTFGRQNRTFLGIVLRDSVVIDLAAANRIVAGGPMTMPSDMKELIARYETGVRDRIAAIVRAVGASTPPYAFDVTAVKTMPPVVPAVMLNAAVNYREHGVEMLKPGASPQVQAPSSAPPPGTAPPGTTSMPGVWERRRGDARWNPYMFLKSPTAIVAHEEAIRIPKGRTRVDWECELGVVIGRQARYVPVARAAEYIFGYTMQMDVSDREARGDGRYGSDWLIAKNHDTFAPLGPFLTPKEFVADPQKLPVTFTLNGRIMQDANTSFMIHDVYELVSYASNIMTLRPGDIVATGSPAGVGSARTPPIFLKAGDRTACTYGGVGTLTNSVQ